MSLETYSSSCQGQLRPRVPNQQVAKARFHQEQEEVPEAEPVASVAGVVDSEAVVAADSVAVEVHQEVVDSVVEEAVASAEEEEAEDDKTLRNLLKHDLWLISIIITLINKIQLFVNQFNSL